MHGTDRRSLLRGELHAGLGGRAARRSCRGGRTASACGRPPATRDRRGTAESAAPSRLRPRRGVARVHRARASAAIDLRALQLAGELGRQLAAAIDLGDELRARAAPPGRRRSAPRPRACFSFAISARRCFERAVRRRAGARDSAGAARRDGDRSRRPPRPSDTRGRTSFRSDDIEEQADVAGAAQLVELDHARFEDRARRRRSLPRARRSDCPCCRARCRPSARLLRSA